MVMSTIYHHKFDASLPPRLDECHESAESLQTTPAAEIGTPGGGQQAGMVVLDSSFQEVPELVDRVQIR
jgi:hypothetical protein